MKVDLTPLSNVNFWIRLGLSGVLGLITTLAVCAHVDGIWQVSSPIRIAIVLVLWLLLGFAAERTMVLLLNGLRKTGWIAGIVVFVLTAGVISMLWLTGTLPPLGAEIPESIWSRIVPLADRLFFSIGLTFFAFSLFLQPAVWSGRTLLEQTLRLAKIYQHDAVFVAAFLALSLLGLLHVKDITQLDQQFFLRKELIQAHENFRLHGLGDRLFYYSIAAENGWLILADDHSLYDFQNAAPFTPEELGSIQSKLDRLNDLLANKGIRFLVIVPPNKNTIYPQYVPEEIPVLNPTSRLDQLVDHQRQYGQAEILDLRAVMRESAQERQVYYATDTHWNPYGAFFAYQETMKALGYSALTLEDYTVQSLGVRNGEIGRMLGSVRIEEEYFALRPVRPVESIHWKSDMNGGILVDTVTNPDTTLPRLLMFRDSFGDALIPFFNAHFHQAIYYHAMPEDDSFYEVVKPDVVILEVTERYLPFLFNLPDE